MLAALRRQLVLEHVRAAGYGDVTDLAVVFGVSDSTVRRDLAALHHAGLLTRIHGGASSHVSAGQHGGAGRQHREARRQLTDDQLIGRAAASLVSDHATILILGGAVAYAMASELADRSGLNVLTNALDVAVALAPRPSIAVIVLGGLVAHDDGCLYGATPERAVRDFHIDTGFVDAVGIDAESGLYAADVERARSHRRLLHRADRLVALARPDAVGRPGMSRVAGIDQVDCVVTRDHAPAGPVHALRERGVRVVTC